MSDNKIRKEAQIAHYKLMGYLDQEELLDLKDRIREYPDDYYIEITYPKLSNMIDEILIRRSNDLVEDKDLHAEVKYLRAIKERAIEFARVINNLTTYD